MKLTIKDRLTLPGLYPEKSNMVTQIIVKDIRAKVDVTQKEVVAAELKATPSGLTWNDAKAPIVTIKFSEAELDLLNEQTKALDKENKITQDLLPVCLAIKKAIDKKSKKEKDTVTE